MNLSKCESPIEVMLAERLCDCGALPVEWEQQKSIACAVKTYRVDFFAERKGRRVVVECDGREFHDATNDYARDVDLIASGGITDILRFRGCDISFLDRLCMDVFRKMVPFLFQEDAEPLKFDDLWSACDGMNHLDVKPIYRGIVKKSQYCEVRKLVECQGVATAMGLTSDDHLAVELKHSNWNWDFKPPKFWQIYDYLRFKIAVRDYKAIEPWAGILGLPGKQFPD